jgi:hypothetical protein
LNNRQVRFGLDARASRLARRKASLSRHRVAVTVMAVVDQIEIIG